MKFSSVLLWALPATFVAAEGDTRTPTHTPGTPTHTPGSRTTGTHTRTTQSRACDGQIYHTLRQEPNAKSFCSSFLRTTVPITTTLPTVTTTVRMTQSKPVATVTSVRTQTSIVYVRSTPYTTTTVTTFSNAAVTCASSAGFFAGSVIPPAGSNDGVTKAPEVEKRTITKGSFTTPSIFSGKPSATISSICSCLHVNVRTKTRGRTTIGQATVTVTSTVVPGGKTSTTTVHSTTTVTSTVTNTAGTQTLTATFVEPVPTTFAGLKWYAYPNSYDFTAGSPVIDVTIFRSNDSQEDSGVVNNPPTVAGGSQAQCTLPGSSKVLNCQQITVVMQAYLYAPADGTYTMTTGGSDASAVDNYLGLWTGNLAYANWNNNNADWIAIREDHSTIQQGGSMSYQFSKGQLIPVTLIYMNGGYGGDFQFEIITPDGTTYTDTSNFWVPACHDSDLFQP